MEHKKRPALYKRILRFFDYFGESFTFRYKDEDNHSTVLGGIICIFFIVIFITYFFYNFTSFINRENFSLQYYALNTENNETIQFKENETVFAAGLDDGNNNIISNLFLLNIRYVVAPKGKKKNYYDLKPRQCIFGTDFTYVNMKSFYDSKINNLLCLSKNELNEYIPYGIYTDDIFSYYEIIVSSKYKNNETHNQLINEYLMKYDCKLQFYHTDISLNLDDLKPFSNYLNSLFLQFNPSLIQKKNIYFINYYLTDDNKFFHYGQKVEKKINRTGLSKVEDYAIYKGLERANRNYTDNDADIYAKIYIRVDNRKIDIKRRYQDFMEFYADTSALILSLFSIFGVFFAYYDRIIANHSISKKLFYFEGITDNIANKRFSKFKNLKNILNTKKKREDDTITNIPVKRMDNGNDKSKIRKVKTLNQRNEGKNINSFRAETKSEFIGKNQDNNLENLKREEDEIETEEKEKQKNIINYNSYNLFEIIWSFKLFFCKTSNFNKKVDLIKQSKNIIDDKLDIVFYIRNMILFEYYIEIYLENESIINFLSRPIIYLTKEKKKLENIIGDLKVEDLNFDDIKNTEKENKDKKSEEIEEKQKGGEQNNKIILQYSVNDLYKSAYKLNSPELERQIIYLNSKPNKTDAEKKIIDFLKKQLKYI